METKHWLASKTIWAALITLIISILTGIGVIPVDALTAADQSNVADTLTTAADVATGGVSLSTALGSLATGLYAIVNIVLRFVTKTGVSA